MKSLFPSAAAAALLLSTAAAAQSATPAPEPTPAAAPEAAAPAAPARTRDFGLLIRMNLDFGGTQLIKVTWTDGDTSTLRAGQLITFSAGVLYRASSLPIAAEATIGYKFDKVNGSNGSIGFTRIPIDLLGAYVLGGHRLGAGATLHLAPTFGCDATGVCTGSVSYDPALGGLLQYAYGWATAGGNSGFEVGLRGTLINYNARGFAPLSGSGVGFFFGGWL